LQTKGTSGCARGEGFCRKAHSRFKYFVRAADSIALTGADGPQQQLLHQQHQQGDSFTASSLTKTAFTDATQAMRYRKLPQLVKARTQVRKSAIEGWGLYALCPIEADDMVIEYVGEVVRRPVSDLRERRYNEKGQGIYMFGLGDSQDVVDASVCGNAARFINHSCEVRCCDPPPLPQWRLGSRMCSGISGRP